MKWFWILFLLPVVLFAQKEDRVWIIGDSNTPNTTAHGGMIINFNHPAPVVTYQYRQANMSACNSSICDKTGNLLFYSNGCVIADSHDEILENGDGINPGDWNESLCGKNKDGYWAGYPSMVILPLPNSDSLYYMFHKSMKYVPGPPEDAYVDKLLYTVIKVTTEEKMITQKNIPLMEDNLATGEMLAVKHANGEDWWLITPRRNSNQFYIFRFTEDGITDTLSQTIGGLPPSNQEALGQTTISPEGNLLVRYFPYNPAMLYDFNRATGQFSNYRTVVIDFGAAWAFDGGCAISPNGRYLYIMALLKAYQFDLWADDISATQTTVAEWDGFIGPIAITFYRSQLGPDCKIYVLGGGDTRYYHVIHNPDMPGLACNFEQRGLVLPTPSGASIPYFPNYRLGPIDNPGQPCTPTVSVSAGPVGAGAEVRVWPNPANQVLNIRCEQVAESPLSFGLYNAVGQLIAQQTLTSQNAHLPIGDLPDGLYYYFVGKGYSGKVIIRH